MRNIQPKINTKTCPFLADKCIKAECGIYNEKFERCEAGLLSYNLYLLATASIIKSQTGAIENTPLIDGILAIGSDRFRF